MTDSAPQYAPDAFNFWFNVQESDKDDGTFWSSSDIPVEEVMKLMDWSSKQDPVQNFQGKPSIKLRAYLKPKVSETSGKRYLQMVISDAKPRREDPNNAPF